MFFVIDRERLRRAIKLTRDGRTRAAQSKLGPFFRLEARDGLLKLTGKEVEAQIPATIYEPGVLFLRITLFRTAVDMLKDEKTLAVQVNAEGLFVDAVRMPLEPNDMLLYVDADRAPQHHPQEPADPETEPPTLFS
jgi:hypothetical protein